MLVTIQPVGDRYLVSVVEYKSCLIYAYVGFLEVRGVAMALDPRSMVNSAVIGVSGLLLVSVPSWAPNCAQ